MTRATDKATDGVADKPTYEATDRAADKATGWRRPWLVIPAALVVAFGVCEALGWPFLATPLQGWIGDTLKRRVSFSEDPHAPGTARIHLLGGITVRADYIEIGAPAWSQAPHMLLARNAVMKLGYLDLWRASRGDPLRIRELRAGHLDGEIERLADGRASWQFGKMTETPDTSEAPTKVPVFGRLQVDAGTMVYRDALTALSLDATYSLVDATNISAAGVQASGSATGLVFNATGTYQKRPLKIDLRTAGVLPVIADSTSALALPVNLDARIGGAKLTFKGTATDALHLSALKGRYTVQGPSLAAVGDPLHLTLPTTPPFRVEGLVVKDGVVWKTVIDAAAIGSSRLAGAFTYDPRPATPMLAGRLSGAKLALADLGPAVGTAAAPTASAPAPAKPTTAKGRVLPDREFDLPSLRAMNANVLIAIDDLDLGSSFLEPLRPLRTHLVLDQGVLSLRELTARTGQGDVAGLVQLDGRNPSAVWTADLRWNGVRLESWIHQQRKPGEPPYASGNLTGQMRVAGQGKSTAAILGSLRGGIRMHVTDGSISHLAVEAAGLDLAQALGVLIKGDKPLTLQCNVVDLVAEQGQLKPKAFLLDTQDSTIVVDGSVSLGTEALNLRVVTSPKDMSPLALRAPIELHGTFADPKVSVSTAPLVKRLGAAGLLALVNPLAALIPLIDLGDKSDAKKDDDACGVLSRRLAAQPTLPPPPPAKAPTAAKAAG